MSFAKFEYISKIDADSQSFGVSIKLQKLPSFHVFLPQNVFMHVIDLKMLSTCSLDQGEHITYPQHYIICHRSVSFAVWNQFTETVKSSFFTSTLEVLKPQDFNTSKLHVKKDLFTVFVN